MNCIKIIEIMTMMQMLETVNIKIKFENRTNNANLITMLRKMPVNRMTETNASDAPDEHVEQCTLRTCDKYRIMTITKHVQMMQTWTC